MAEGALPVAAIWDEIPADSSTAVVERIARHYRELGCDSLLALGGGSVIDTAKAVNILATLGGERLLDYAGADCLTHPLNPLAVVPTTAGTGSEVTLVAVIKDEGSGRKVPFTSPFLLPRLAVLDPRFTLGLPLPITAATAMDAMTHAIEAFIGNGKNPVSDALALMAVEKIATALPRVLAHPTDKGLRLPLVGPERFAATPAEGRPQATIEALQALRDTLWQTVKLPRTLREAGLTDKALLPGIRDLAINDGALLYNRKDADRDQLLVLLERAWE